jgi:hypothetical protein
MAHEPPGRDVREATDRPKVSIGRAAIALMVVIVPWAALVAIAALIWLAI